MNLSIVSLKKEGSVPLPYKNNIEMYVCMYVCI